MFYHRVDSTHERRVELEKMRDERRPNRKNQHRIDFQRDSRSENTHFAILETQNLSVRGSIFKETKHVQLRSRQIQACDKFSNLFLLETKRLMKAFYSTFSIYFHA